MASLSTCHLGLWLGWQILLNLVKSPHCCFRCPLILHKVSNHIKCHFTLLSLTSPHCCFRCPLILHKVSNHIKCHFTLLSLTSPHCCFRCPLILHKVSNHIKCHFTLLPLTSPHCCFRCPLILYKVCNHIKFPSVGGGLHPIFGTPFKVGGGLLCTAGVLGTFPYVNNT